MQVTGKAAIAVQQATAEMNARPGAAEPGAAQNAAREFEALFLTQAVEEMMRSVDVGDFGGGHAEETWRSFLARAIADEIAAQGRTGVAQSVQSVIASYNAASAQGD